MGTVWSVEALLLHCQQLTTAVAVRERGQLLEVAAASTWHPFNECWAHMQSMEKAPCHPEVLMTFQQSLR